MNMATTGEAYNWPSSPPHRSSPHNPDTTSPVYPDRPIRPLPKRRLRDRLSADQSDTIAFPPEGPNSSPIFSYPYAQTEQDRPGQRPLRAGSMSEPCLDCGHDHDHSEGPESEEDEDEARQRTMQFSSESLQITRRDGDYYGNGKAAMRTDWDSKPLPPGSTASSADGYESFENTNNKKKRKIPQSNTSGHGHQSTLSADMANMGISQLDGEPARLADGTASHTAYTYGHQTISSAPATAGASAGKGRDRRSGRGSLERRPLGLSMNGSNVAVAARGRQTSSPKSATQQPGEPGIISAAIANAQRSTTPPNGDDTTSLLQQEASKSPPQKTDFTFTPDGGENRPVWPGQHPNMPAGYQPPPPAPNQAANQPGRRGVAHGTQTSPNVNGLPQMPLQPPYPQHQQQQLQQAPAQAGAPPPLPKQKKPRQPGRIYTLAARQRRIQQEYQNYHHPPKREDIWICEFCEYETIFGGPPRALIKQYEIKDRKVRKEIAERRRLLEKAKNKGKKGKKGGNKGKNNANHSQQQPPPPNPNQRYDPPLDDHVGDQEDYYEEDDDYEYDDEGLDSLPPTPHPHAHATAGAQNGYPLGPPPKLTKAQLNDRAVI